MKENKKEITLILCGMVISLCLIFHIGASFFSFTNTYLNTDSTDASEYQFNRIYFSFADSDKINKIVSTLTDNKYVKGVYLEAALDDGEMIQTGTDMPYVVEDEVMLGHIPKTLKDGEIIVSYTILSNTGSRNILRNGQEYSSSGYAAVGDELIYGDKTYQVIAEMNDSNGNIVTIHDFYEIYHSLGDGAITLSYVFKDEMTDKEKNSLSYKINNIKEYENTWDGIYNQNIDWNYFFEMSKLEIIGVIIASLNTMLLYIYFLKKRIKNAAVLKMLGMKNRQIRGVWMLEYLLIYLTAVAVSVIFYKIYLRQSDVIYFKTTEIMMISILCIWGIYVTLFLLFTKKYVMKNPFELYTEVK
jgi:hypothetical protein